MTDLKAQEATFSAPYIAPYPIIMSSGQGSYVFDENHKRYLDMASGISVTNFGHQHPKLLQTLIAQAQQVAIVPRLFHNTKLPPLLEYVCQLSAMDCGIPMNSGAEAVETAIKVVRKWGYQKKQVAKDRAEIIVCADNFHGRTTTTISMSSTAKYKNNFGPLTPGFTCVPFNDPTALAAAITPNTVAFIVEPIQGEAGVKIPDAGYLQQCQQICQQNNILLIFDEIQTGMGRTGKFLAHQHENVQPDGILMGKALGGGLLPISLFLAKNAVMQVLQPGDHGSTFGGNPLASAVALSALQLLFEENLIENSATLGSYFLDQLHKIHSPIIADVHGKGLMIAVDINTEIISSATLSQKLMDNGLLNINTRNKTLRFFPPLNITKQQIDEGLAIIQQTITQITESTNVQGGANQ